MKFPTTVRPVPLLVVSPSRATYLVATRNYLASSTESFAAAASEILHEGAKLSDDASCRVVVGDEESFVPDGVRLTAETDVGVFALAALAKAKVKPQPAEAVLVKYPDAKSYVVVTAKTANTSNVSFADAARMCTNDGARVNDVATCTLVIGEDKVGLHCDRDDPKQWGIILITQGNPVVQIDCGKMSVATLVESDKPGIDVTERVLIKRGADAIRGTLLHGGIDPNKKLAGETIAEALSRVCLAARSRTTADKQSAAVGIAIYNYILELVPGIEDWRAYGTANRINGAWLEATRVAPELGVVAALPEKAKQAAARTR